MPVQREPRARAVANVPRAVAAAVVVALALAASQRAASAEEETRPEPKPDYVQEGEYFPKGPWPAGFGAVVESSSFEGREPGATTTRSPRYGITSRNGYFLANRFLIGLRASYDVSLHRMTLPTATGGAEAVSEGSEQSFEVGPWFRYYFPVGNGWALFGEADWSYRTYVDEEKARGGLESKSTGRGLAIGMGGGITYFLTKGIAFDVAGRVSADRDQGSRAGQRHAHQDGFADFQGLGTGLRHPHDRAFPLARVEHPWKDEHAGVWPWQSDLQRRFRCHQKPVGRHQNLRRLIRRRSGGSVNGHVAVRGWLGHGRQPAQSRELLRHRRPPAVAGAGRHAARRTGREPALRAGADGAHCRGLRLLPRLSLGRGCA